MKQETLEEAAEKYAEGKSSNPTFRNTHIRDFIAGAKWQQEQMYSVEDLESAWNSSEQNMRFQFSSSAYKGIRFEQWLEKFKQEKEL